MAKIIVAKLCVQIDIILTQLREVASAVLMTALHVIAHESASVAIIPSIKECFQVPKQGACQLPDILIMLPKSVPNVLKAVILVFL